jgi:hypothetical protein
VNDPRPTGGVYGREALRRLRDQQARHTAVPEGAASPIDEVPADAKYESPDDVLHAWDGQKWIPWPKWQVTAATAHEKPGPETSRQAADADAGCVAGHCAGARIVLAQEGERWFMYVGALRAANRRKDFASPFLAHAVRTAEAWYGVPAVGWHAEVRADGKQKPTAGIPAENSPAQEADSERGRDDVGDGVVIHA